MRDEIKRRLDRIDELFPPSRIEKSKARWTALYNKKKPLDRLPYTSMPPTVGIYLAAFDKKQRLEELLDDIITRGPLDDDYIPALFTGCRQSAIPSMFGAEEFLLEDDLGNKKIIFSPDDIKRLPQPSFPDGSSAKYWLEMEEYFLCETCGRIPCHVCDMQGPFDAAGQVWSYDEAFVLAYEDPELYSEFMGKLTDAYMLLWGKQKELLGDLFVGTHLYGWNWTPADWGASMSIDSLVMLSPSFYDTYYKPVIERIADKFGNISVHSCGNFSAVVKNVCATKSLEAINASQMNLEELYNAGMYEDKIAIFFVPYTMAGEMAALSKKTGIRIDMSVHGILENKLYTNWTDEDYRRVSMIDAEMKEIFSV